MKVIANGTQRELTDGAKLDELLVLLGVPERGIAVAVNGQLVSRNDWPTTALADGAQVEVLTAVQGG
jgi:sulfur carrier protein